ncbi:MAG: DUF1540 domain-containing protein [Clostridia bacterium]|nr:DUF1540 domain-containing protein [Clostridia bacterium]
MNDCSKGGCTIKKHNEGISCMVKNCTYHDGERYCTVKEISVGPNHAKTSADTICATFKARD